MAKLILIRHGQSLWNALNKFTCIPIAYELDPDGEVISKKILND